MNTYTPPAVPAVRVPGLRAELVPGESGMPRDTEYVRFWVDEQYHGLVVLPSMAAYDLLHRMADAPSPASEMTSETIGHVLWWLDRDYRDSAGPDAEPSAWTCELIELIRTAPEEQRRLLGLGHRAYTAAVTIATSASDGLDHLRRMHDVMRRADAAAAG